MRVAALLFVIACAWGALVACSPPPPLRPKPEPREESPIATMPPPATATSASPPPPPPPPEPPPEPKTLQSFPGIDLLESSNIAMHEHGGPAAQIRHVRLEFEITDRRAHAIEARKVELLRRHCREDKWHDRRRLELTGYFAAWGDPGQPGRGEIQGKARIVLPAGEPRRTTVYVDFKPVEAYQACDNFGFALDIVVDRVRHVFELPLDITRIEPLE